MIEPSVMSPEPPEQPGMDYALLRREGIDFIIKLAGDYWTNYNIHDPGVTILELLCYAITDLSYRLEFDIRDILTEPPDGGNDTQPQFFSARNILTVNPVTIEDYRKIIIDVDGVRNAWVETTGGPFNTKGFYNISIEPEAALEIAEDTLAERVRTRLNARRNLCEEFLAIAILDTEDIEVSAGVSLEIDADATAVLNEIYTRLSGFISPAVSFLTLDEMRARGYTAEEIFNGPRLEHGFIDPKSLAESEWKTQIHASDLIHLIQDIRGVRAVDNLRMAGADGREHAWALDLTSGKAPRWRKGPGIKLFKGNKPCLIDEQRLNQGEDSARLESGPVINEQALDLPLPAGRYRNIDDYETIQNDLPLNYGVGHFGLPEGVSPRRKALANQLRGYLMLFDQLLANYLSQLYHVKDLFSIYGSQTASYFCNILPEEVESVVSRKALNLVDTEKFFIKLMRMSGEDFRDTMLPLSEAQERREKMSAELQEMLETPHTALDRKNRFLNHLLARYAEEFADVSLLFSVPDVTAEYLAAKQEFLKQYPTASADRGKAFDYTLVEPVWDSENVSGLEQRIALKLGIAGFMRRRLSEGEEEGFHLIEHLLLLPASGERDNQAGDTGYQPDQYSFCLSFIFPDWAGRFRDESFRQLVEEIIWTEIPAHIQATILWQDRDFIREFENWYELWLPLKSADSSENREPAEKLIELLGIGKPAQQ